MSEEVKENERDERIVEIRMYLPTGSSTCFCEIQRAKDSEIVVAAGIVQFVSLTTRKLNTFCGTFRLIAEPKPVEPETVKESDGQEEKS